MSVRGAFRCPCAGPSDVRARGLPMSVRGAAPRPRPPPSDVYARGGCLPACWIPGPCAAGDLPARTSVRTWEAEVEVEVEVEVEAERVAVVIHNSP